MMLINLAHRVGDSTVAEVIIALLLVAFVYWFILLYISRLLSSSRLPKNYPTMEEARNASDQQIITWAFELPIAETEDELKIIGYIVGRYVELMND